MTITLIPVEHRRPGPQHAIDHNSPRDPEGSSKKYKQGGGDLREGAPCKEEEVEREKAGFAAADGFEKPENLGGVA